MTAILILLAWAVLALLLVWALYRNGRTEGVQPVPDVSDPAAAARLERRRAAR